MDDSFDVVEKTISELQAAMAAGDVTSRALVAHYLARIEAYDQRGPALNAMIARNPRALAEAEALDDERARSGPRGPLHGIPIAIKDNFDVVGLPTTGGSIALAAFQPPDDAFQVARLRRAGAVIIGKTNLHEFARGITTISSLGGQTRNPYDLARTPGGSSGGTAAAVAASFAAAGMGSDTCGSIRIPAAHNSLVGLRATHGLSSRDGIMPLAHSFDVGGPLARTVTDLAIVMDATFGPDPADPATARSRERHPGGFVDALDPDALSGAKIGVLDDLFGSQPEDKQVAGIVRATLGLIADRGAELVPLEIPGWERLLVDADIRVIIDHEYTVDLANYLTAGGAPVTCYEQIRAAGLHHAFLVATFERTDAITAADTPAYREAQARRGALRDGLRAAMDQRGLTALAYPMIRRKPARIDVAQYGSNCPVSALSGFPALTVPAGFTPDGLPVGLELLGRPYSDRALVGLGYAIEQATHHRRPPDTTPALIDGEPPAPVAFAVQCERVQARFAFDVTRSELRYHIEVTAARDEDVLYAGLHRGADQPGPAVFRLLRHARAGSGVLALHAGHRDDLRGGALSLSVLTRDRPDATRHPLVAP